MERAEKDRNGAEKGGEATSQTYSNKRNTQADASREEKK